MNPADAKYQALCCDARPLTLSRLWEGSTVVPQSPSHRAAEDPFAVWADSLAMEIRIDGVDETLTPFVPFVRQMTAREMARVAYGVMLNMHERSALVSLEPGGPLVSLDESIELLLVTIDAAAREEGATPSFAVIPQFRLRFGRIPAAMAQQREAAKTQGVEDVLPGAMYGLQAVHVASVHAPIHTDVRPIAAESQQPLYAQQYNPRVTAPLEHRKKVWRLWKRLTRDSTISGPDGELSIEALTPPATPERANRNELTRVASPGGHSTSMSPRKCGFEIEELAGADVNEYVDAASPPMSSIRFGIDFIPRRCSYVDDRMAARVVVARRPPTGGAGAVMDAWDMMVKELADGPAQAAHPEVGDSPPASRVLFREQRGDNICEEGELLAHPPAEPMSAAERLRLWIAKAVLTAEVHGIRQLLIPLDCETLLARCAEIATLPDARSLHSVCEVSSPGTSAAAAAALMDDGMELADGMAGSVSLSHTRIIRGVIHAVSEVVRTSGVVWRVVILAPSEPTAAAAQEILMRLRMRDAGEESAQPTVPTVRGTIIASPELSRRRAAASAEKYESGQGARAALADRPSRLLTPRLQAPDGTASVTVTELPALPMVRAAADTACEAAHIGQVIAAERRGRSESKHRTMVAASEAEVPQARPSSRPATARLSDWDLLPDAVDSGNIIMQAAITGRPVDEEDVIQLFHRLDRDGNGRLARGLVRCLLLKEKADGRPTSRGGPGLKTGGVLAPMDDCGLGSVFADELLDRHVADEALDCDQFTGLVMELARL